MPKSTAEQYRAFLEAEKQRPTRPRCSVCKNPTVAELIVLHLDALAGGQTAVTLSHVHTHLLIKHGAPKSYSAVCRHVNMCLRRDVTGAPHGEETTD